MSAEMLVTSFPLDMDALGRECVDSASRLWRVPMVYLDAWADDRCDRPPRLTEALPRWRTVRTRLATSNPVDDKPTNYIWNARKFAVKPFVWLDAALALGQGVLVWIDADCVVTARVPTTLASSTLADADVAYLGRGDMHPETGVVVFRLPEARPLLQYCVDLYATDAYRQLSTGWTDCHVLRAAIAVTGIRAADLTSDRHAGPWRSAIDAMALSPFGPYVTHRKGCRAKREAARAWACEDCQ